MPGSVVVSYRNSIDSFTANSLYICPVRTINICCTSIAVYICPIDYRRISYNSVVIISVYIVTAYIMSLQIPVSYEHPIISVPVISSSKTEINAYSRSHWRPAVIAACSSPGYPCRTPLVVRYPKPAIVSIIVPPAIMKRSPAPVIVGDPCPSVIGEYPVSI